MYSLLNIMKVVEDINVTLNNDFNYNLREYKMNWLL